jgi:uncharacterized protein YqjF (DUF2071 family)
MRSGSLSKKQTMDVLSHSDHRPWVLPDRPWVMAQSWHNLLFAHWPVPLETLQSFVPEPLQIDTFRGQAWLGVIPFRLSGIRLRWMPALPFVSSFAEINVRTYVTLGDKPGVLFLSMDAGNMPGTAIARPTFRVPYTYADVGISRHHDSYAFHCARRAAGSRLDANFRAIYRPASRPFRPQPASLDRWLTERYCYYSVTKGRAYRCEIAHAPWLLRHAQATIADNTMASALGIELPDSDPLLNYAHRMDAIFWWPSRVRSTEDYVLRTHASGSPVLPGIRHRAGPA